MFSLALSLQNKIITNIIKGTRAHVTREQPMDTGPNTSLDAKEVSIA